MYRFLTTYHAGPTGDDGDNKRQPPEHPIDDDGDCRIGELAVVADLDKLVIKPSNTKSEAAAKSEPPKLTEYDAAVIHSQRQVDTDDTPLSSMCDDEGTEEIPKSDIDMLADEIPTREGRNREDDVVGEQDKGGAAKMRHKDGGRKLEENEKEKVDVDVGQTDGDRKTGEMDEESNVGHTEHKEDADEGLRVDTADNIKGRKQDDLSQYAKV